METVKYSTLGFGALLAVVAIILLVILGNNMIAGKPFNIPALLLLSTASILLLAGGFAIGSSKQREPILPQ